MSGFKFNFDDTTQKAPELTTKNQEWLRQIEMKISGIRAFAKIGGKNGNHLTEDIILGGEREIVRLEAAYKDVKKRMSKEEKAEYKAVMKALQPKALTKEQQAAITKQMESNRDRPSH